MKVARCFPEQPWAPFLVDVLEFCLESTSNVPADTVHLIVGTYNEKTVAQPRKALYDLVVSTVDLVRL